MLILANKYNPHLLQVHRTDVKSFSIYRCFSCTKHNIAAVSPSCLLASLSVGSAVPHYHRCPHSLNTACCSREDSLKESHLYLGQCETLRCLPPENRIHSRQSRSVFLSCQSFIIWQVRWSQLIWTQHGKELVISWTCYGDVLICLFFLSCLASLSSWCVSVWCCCHCEEFHIRVFHLCSPIFLRCLIELRFAKAFSLNLKRKVLFLPSSFWGELCAFKM